ncbi:hypothetical protein [Nocardioides sp. MH1]|uniref:hypothetical protein n=1 Tax=Nocardioides sp. MH1 TaxID=3242490 RepID=UPI00352255F1
MDFDLFAVCDEVPGRWHGEVRFGGEILLRTEIVTAEAEAGRLAESLLRARVVEIFRQPSSRAASSGT